MKTLVLAGAIALLTATLGIWAQTEPVAPDFAGGGMTCFFKSDTISGLNKICYYDCAGSEAAITVKSHQLCPLNIKR